MRRSWALPVSTIQSIEASASRHGATLAVFPHGWTDIHHLYCTFPVPELAWLFLFVLVIPTSRWWFASVWGWPWLTSILLGGGFSCLYVQESFVHVPFFHLAQYPFGMYPVFSPTAGAAGAALDEEAPRSWQLVPDWARGVPCPSTGVLQPRGIRKSSCRTLPQHGDAPADRVRWLCCFWLG